MKTLTSSQALKVNTPQIFINWSKDFIRVDYKESLNEYLQAKAREYTTESIGLDRDITYNKALDMLRVACLNVNKGLQSHLRREISINQTKEGINEVKSAIKYWNEKY